MPPMQRETRRAVEIEADVAAVPAGLAEGLERPDLEVVAVLHPQGGDLAVGQRPGGRIGNLEPVDGDADRGVLRRFALEAAGPGAAADDAAEADVGAVELAAAGDVDRVFGGVLD